MRRGLRPITCVHRDQACTAFLPLPDPNMSKPALVAFDPADHLVDDAAIAIYLTEALAADDAVHFQDALQAVARARGMTQVAEASGLGRESLYKALKPGAHPRFDTVQRVLGALGVRIVITPLEQPGTA